MRDTIEAPPQQQPRYGLIAAAAAVDNAGERWEQGVTFAPEGCGAGLGGVVEADCTPGTSVLGTPSSNPAAVGFDAFEVWAADRCSALQTGLDRPGRARRRLEGIRSFQMAKELWGGALTQARHIDDDVDEVEGPSPYLKDGDSTAKGSAVGMLAVAKADAEFAACSSGRRAMLHLTPWALAVAMNGASEYIYRDGNLLLTQLGSIVVADAGYGDSTTDLKVFATGLVSVRLGPVRVTPSSNEPAELAAALDRSTNTITAWAQQEALYQFDADCCRITTTITTS